MRSLREYFGVEHEGRDAGGCCGVEIVYTASTLPGTRYYSGEPVPNAGEHRERHVPASAREPDASHRKGTHGEYWNEEFRETLSKWLECRHGRLAALSEAVGVRHSSLQSWMRSARSRPAVGSQDKIREAMGRIR